MRHVCHHPTCEVEVPPKLMACRKHWLELPRRIRLRVWATYRPGQEVDKKPSRAYIQAAREARDFWLSRTPSTSTECLP